MGSSNDTRTVNRRIFLGGTFAAAIGSTALGACGADNTSGSGGSTEASLRVGVPTDIVPASTLLFTPHNQPLRRTVFDYLLDLAPDGSYQPGLATEWEWNSDNTKLLLTLRDGVTFHDGRAFGPDDVIFTIQSALKPESGAQVAQLLERGGEPKKVGKNQVEIEFDTPFLAYLDAFAALPVVDSNTFAGYEAGEEVIGTGPFTWKSWSPGQQLELGRHDDYWDGKPAISELTLRVFSEPQALLAALRSGELDLANRMVPRDAVGLEEDGGFWMDTPPSHDIYVGANTAVKPLDDIRVRQAINYSIDRARIVDQVYSGLAEPSCVPWLGQTPGVTPEMINQYPLDLDRARGLIVEAGAEGATVKTTPSPADPAFDAINDILTFGLSEIGLKPETVTFDAAEYPQHIQAGDLPGLFVGQVALTSMGPTTALLTASPFRSDKNTHNFTPGKYGQLVDSLVEAATEPDQEAAVGELTSYLVDQSFHATVVQAASPTVGVEGLSDVELDVTQALRLGKAKLGS